MATQQFEVQAALYPYLAEHDAITFEVYDFLPEDAPFPYAVIGDSTGDEYHTKTTKGERITITFHLWSDYQGKKEAKQLINILENVLRAFTMPGLRRVGRDDQDFFNEGYLTHGVIIMHFVMEG